MKLRCKDAVSEQMNDTFGLKAQIRNLFIYIYKIYQTILLQSKILVQSWKASFIM